jgi:hypothetical protein
MYSGKRITYVWGLVLLGIIAVSAFVMAQTSGTTGPVMRFTATTVNVSGAPDSVRIDVLAWSTDADRDQMLGAWNLTAVPGAGARGAAGARGGDGARGARGGGRGGETPQAGAAPPAEAGAAGAAAGAAAAGGGGRGARGGGRGAAGAGGGDAPAARPTPERALATALQGAKTIGYLWTSESAGYSLKYAYRLPQPDGGERIIFATDRRLGGWNDLWKPAGASAVNDYDFSLIEVRINAKGIGEGKASLTGKVAVDSAINSIALDGYTTLPVVLKDIKRRTN